MTTLTQTQTRPAPRRINLWHCFGRETVGAERTSIDAFLEGTGFDHEIRKDPVYALSDRGYQRVPNQFHLVSTRDERVVSPSTVSDRFTPLQPRTLVDTVAPLVREGIAQFDRIWRIDGGSIEGIQLELGTEARMLQGDPSTFRTYLLLTNRHGRGAATLSVTTKRCVCNNAWLAAMTGGETIRVQHTGNVDDRYKWAFQSLEKVREWMRLNLPRLEVFAQEPVKDVRRTCAEILGLDIAKPQDWSTRALNRLNDVVDATFRSPGVTGSGTKLDVLNGVSWVNTHRITSTENAAAKSALEGTRRALELRAMKVLAAV